MFKKRVFFVFCLWGMFINAQTILLGEDFSGGSLPSGWSNIDNGSSPAGDIWQFNDPGGRNITAGSFSGNFAILDSDNYGSGNSQEATLETPSFATGLYATITLEYDYQYRDYQSPESCTVEVFNGTTWTAVANYTTNSGDNYSGATHVTLDITTEAGAASNVKVRFTYTGDWDWWWALDNVKVTGTAASSIVGYLGPGGVGNTDGSSNLEAWYYPKNIRNSSNVLPSDGESIDTWLDASGNTNTVTNSGTATYESDGGSLINGNAVMKGTSLNRKFVTSGSFTGKTLIAVNNPGARNSFEGVVGFNGDKGIRRPSTIDNTWQYPGGGGGTNNDTWSTNTGKSYINGSTATAGIHNNQLHFVSQERPSTFSNKFYIGGYYSGRSFTGSITEIIAFDANLNLAQKIIIDNYLSAKYAITIAASDLFTQDNIVNGNFDYNVAGIGRASDGSLHLDSQGTGIVRINTPSDINNNEFLFWGEDVNGANYTFSSDASSDYLERLDTKWRVNKIGDLGTVTLAIDASTITLNSVDGCNDLKLIVSSSSTFTSKTTYNLVLSGGIYTATGVSFSDGDYFTLEYKDLIVVDGTQFYNGSGVSNVPDITDDCYKLLVKNTADGTLTLTENADVREVEIETDGKLVADDGIRLQVTNGILLNGDFVLSGESELIQLHTGASLVTGTGKLYRNRDAINANKYTYNYWGSPVHDMGSSTYTILGTLKDDFNPATLSYSNLTINTTTPSYPIDNTVNNEIYRRWLYKFEDVLGWEKIDENTAIATASGFTMKGDGTAETYTFTGIPNDGDISKTITANNLYLVGNPYPSALNADTFITDNVVGTIISGTLHFWEHDQTETSHLKGAYKGNYSTRVIGLGTPAPSTNGSAIGTAPTANIAIGQGFFIGGDTGGTVNFKNSQRNFGGNTHFFKGKKKKKSNFPVLRLSFEFDVSPGERYHRQLAVGFRGLDNQYQNGYDGAMFDKHPTDAALKIENNENPFVITGIEKFHSNLEIPLEVYLDETRTVTFGIDGIESLKTEIFIKDTSTSLYYDLLAGPVSFTLDAGTYSDRFFITFSEEILAVDNDLIKSNSITVHVDDSSKEMLIRKSNTIEIQSAKMYTVLGKEVGLWKNSNPQSKTFRIRIPKLSTAVYLVELQTNKGVFSRKVIVVN